MAEKLTDEQDYLLMCAIENLRSADRNDRTVEAAWRMAEKMEAWRKASAAAHAAEISGSNIVRTCEPCEG